MRGGDVDDASPIALAHLRDDSTDCVKIRRQAYGDYGVPSLDRKLLNRRSVLNARIVDQNINPAQFTRGGFNQFHNLGWLRQVGRIEGDPDPKLLCNLRAFFFDCGWFAETI